MLHKYTWYISDWRDSETRLNMTAEERGIYRELLDWCYREGDLPTNSSSLIKIADSTEKEFKRVWPNVSRNFVEIGGRLHNLKVDEIRPGMVRSQASARKRGARGANARWNGQGNAPTNAPTNASGNGSANAYQMLNECYRSKDYRLTTSPLPPGWSPDWEKFASEFPGELNPDFDCQMFLSVVQTPEDERELFSGLDRLKVTEKWQRGFIPTASNFLRKRSWKTITQEERTEQPRARVMM